MKLKQRWICGVAIILVMFCGITFLSLSPESQIYLLGARAAGLNSRYFQERTNDGDPDSALILSNRTVGDNGVLLRRQLEKSASQSGSIFNRSGELKDSGSNRDNNTLHSNFSGKVEKLLKSENLNRTPNTHIQFHPGKEFVSSNSKGGNKTRGFPDEGNFYNIPHKYPKGVTAGSITGGKFAALFRNFPSSYKVPRHADKLVRLKKGSHNKSTLHTWESFHLQINRYEVYSYKSSLIDKLIHRLATSKLKSIEEKSGGTQVKMKIVFSNDGEALMKPWRVPREYETLPDHFYFSDIERHNAEIAAFHLDRILDFRRTPPVAGRWFNITTDIFDLADSSLRKTFFRSPANNLCFIGHCSYYCESETAVCGKPDMIEGSIAAYLPAFKPIAPRKTWRHPWRRSYSKHKVAVWEHDLTYCHRIVMRRHPYSKGRRLLDIIDMSIYDFLMGNLDRHHYETFEAFGNFTFPIHLDHGRAFGKYQTDDVSILAPLYQCCIVRNSTYERLLTLSKEEYRLGDVMRESLSHDVISPVLFEPHFSALDRRLGMIIDYIHKCINKDNTTEVLLPEPDIDNEKPLKLHPVPENSELDDLEVDF